MKKYKDIAGDGGSNIVGQVEAQQAKLQGNLAAVRALVAVVSGKGGVGKSSVTAGLACAFALGGARVVSSTPTSTAQRWRRCSASAASD